MRFGTTSAPTALRPPGIPWLPSSLLNLLPVRKEKPSPRKAEKAATSGRLPISPTEWALIGRWVGSHRG
jgi:hypothetical protein